MREGARVQGRIELGVEGMTCASCAVTIEEALRRVPGVAMAVVNPVSARRW